MRRQAGGKKRGAAGRPAGGVGFALVMAAAVVLSPGAGPAEPGTGATPAPAAPDLATAAIAVRPAEVWQTIRYRGHHWLGQFSAELEIQAPDPSSPVAVQRSPWVAELRARVDSFLLADKATRIRAWFDPASAAVSRFTKLSLGPRPDLKTYEFEATGVARMRIEPDVGQAELAPEQWSRTKRSFHSYDPEEYGCRVVSDPGALAYWLTWGPAAATARTEDPGACFFSGKTLYRIDFRHIGSGTARVDYRILREGRSARRRGRVSTERYAAIARPVAGELDETPTRAEIVLEAESRLPWRFVTHEGPLELDVQLREVVLGDPLLLAGRGASER